MIHARFLMSLKRRRGRPSAWLSAPRGAAAVRPCGPDGPALITNVAGSLVYCWPQNAGADVRPLGFPRNDPRRAFALAALRAGADQKNVRTKKDLHQPHASPQTAVRLRSRSYRASADPTRALNRREATSSATARPRPCAEKPSGRTPTPALEACVKTRPKAQSANARRGPFPRKSQVGGRPRRRLRPTRKSASEAKSINQVCCANLSFAGPVARARRIKPDPIPNSAVKTPQRQWYCVSRPGRVGRRRARKRQANNHHPLTIPPNRTPHAGWSSPVARQAHNLKVVGSNPTPRNQISQ